MIFAKHHTQVILALESEKSAINEDIGVCQPIIVEYATMYRKKLKLKEQFESAIKILKAFDELNK